MVLYKQDFAGVMCGVFLACLRALDTTLLDQEENAIDVIHTTIGNQSGMMLYLRPAKRVVWVSASKRVGRGNMEFYLADENSIKWLENGFPEWIDVGAATVRFSNDDFPAMVKMVSDFLNRNRWPVMDEHKDTVFVTYVTRDMLNRET